jgi:hypothetical protein
VAAREGTMNPVFSIEREETLDDADSWLDRLVHALEQHIADESAALREYAGAVAEVEGPDTRYLLDLILEDESRHHQVLRDIIEALRSQVDWPHARPLPPLATNTPSTEAVRKLARRLELIEHSDARELRELAKLLKPLSRTTIWPLLVDLVANDTKKHQLILRYLSRR